MDYWYELYGDGVPIVLLHGFTGSGETWKNFISTSSAGFEFITIDLPGHGKTKPHVLKTMDECIDDLHQLFKELNRSKFILVGYSMGGRTALSYAAKYPEMLAGLVLESASPGLSEESARIKRRNQDEKLAKKIEEEGIQEFVNYWENIPLFETQKRLREEIQSKIRAERLAQSVTGLANSLRGMGTGSQRSNWEQLETLSIPVLLLAGELDPKFVKINEDMKNRIPNAELKLFPDAGHAIHVEKPQAFQKSVLAFAKRYTT